MRICITCLGSTLDSQIDPRFGRAQYFLIVNEKGKLEEAVANPGIRAMRGAGISAAQEISNKGVNILITGNIGPNAFGVLATTGIKVFLVSSTISAKEAFKMWKENKLSEVKAPSVGGHFGMGPPSGRGGLGGRGGRGGRGGPGNSSR